MADANQEYFDASLRHHIGVRRFSSQQVNSILSLIEKSDRSLVRKLRRGVSGVAGKPYTPQARERIVALLSSLRKLRAELVGQIQADFMSEMRSFAKHEVAVEIENLKFSIPFELTFAQPNLTSVAAAALARPFADGTHLEAWFKGLLVSEQANLEKAIQLGVTQGESIDKIVSRVVGTRSNGYRDGVLSMTRRNAEAVVRTGVNHISNFARESVWEANSDILSAVRWVSTLDGRTSAICRARDGQMAPLGNHKLPKGTPRLDPATARPPAHVNCRSLVVALVEGQSVIDKIGDRPYVLDSRTRQRRELDFKAEASRRGMTVKQVREQWKQKAIGTVPKDETYGSWLKRQSTEFQNEVLGVTKGKLFRKGGLTLDRFVDRKGHELSLGQLAARDRKAFTKAGLEPDAFIDE